MKTQTKKLLVGIAMIMLMMTVLCFSASAITEGPLTEGIYTYMIQDDNAIIYLIDADASGKIVVPDTLGGYSVTEAMQYSFAGREITEITLPDSLTRMGNGAFMGCEQLKKINFGTGLKHIGDRAFEECTSLTEIVIPDSVTEFGDSVSSGTFRNCTALKNVTLSKNAKKLASAMFYNCSSLESIEIPNGVIGIEDNMFAYCTNLKNVKIPGTVTYITVAAFSYCKSLESIVIPEGVTTIGYTDDDNYGYDYGDGAVFGRFCENLTSVYLPASLSTIGYDVFFGLDEIITDIYYAGTEEQWSNISILRGNDSLSNATIHFAKAPVHSHSYTAVTTLPTCTSQGYTTYTCDCSDSYIADYVTALGHKDANDDYKCDNGCGYEYEKPAVPDTPEDPSANCSCNCHKSGFMGFIWKILRIFYKIFKTNSVCECGAAHY